LGNLIPNYELAAISATFGVTYATRDFEILAYKLIPELCAVNTGCKMLTSNYFNLEVHLISSFMYTCLANCWHSFCWYSQKSRGILVGIAFVTNMEKKI
jgi:hypothetical protein